MKRPSAVVAAVVAALAAAMVLAGLPCHGADGRPGVEFYLLSDEGLDFEAARKKPLADLVLQVKPWIASEDILRYDWSSHCIHLKKEVSIAWRRIGLRGTPFVVVADGQRCYLGALWSPISSFVPMGSVPMIHNVGMSGPKDLLALDLMSALQKGQQRVDLRDDPRVAKALRRQGQFHAGLQCWLNKVQVNYQEDTCSVVYSLAGSRNSSRATWASRRPATNSIPRQPSAPTGPATSSGTTVAATLSGDVVEIQETSCGEVLRLLSSRRQAKGVRVAPSTPPEESGTTGQCLEVLPHSRNSTT